MSEHSFSADLRRQPGPHVFVADLVELALDDADRHHLSRALRVRDGDPLTVSDGRGSWRRARFGPELRADGDIVTVRPASPPVGLAVALTKSGKPELVVQKATELGVDRLVFFHAERSVARWDATKRARGLERLDRVAREAGMQSRRVRLPVVEFVDALGSIAPAAELVRADFGGDPIGPQHHMVAIGPEGGWTDTEAAQIPATVDLGPTVLRAETAAVAAVAFMASFRDS